MKASGRILRLLFIGLVFFWACTPEEEIVTQDPNARLSFSENAVVFDTIFTGIKSITRRLTVYNLNKKAVVIDDMYIGNPTGSPYEIFINGQILAKASKIRLLGGDSLLVLVKAFINPRNENVPFVNYDSLMFQTNGNLQNIKLLAWGQDAHFIRYTDIISTCNLTWTSDKPYILLDSIIIPQACKFTLMAGTQVYSYSKTRIIIKGSLDVQGTLQEPVVFADFQRLKENAPGQWQGITFEATSKDNTIKSAEIRNAVTGLDVRIDDEDTIPDIAIENTVIKNMLQAGISAIDSDITLTNSLLTNCVFTLFEAQGGGNYTFKHCTFANYTYNFGRELPAVLMSNTYKTLDTDIKNPLRWHLQNSIIWGSFSDEILLVNNPLASFTVVASHNILKTEPISFFQGNNNLLNIKPNPLFVDPQFLDFRPDSLSPLINAGMVIGITEDIAGKSRDEKPDIGAYEY